MSPPEPAGPCANPLILAPSRSHAPSTAAASEGGVSVPTVLIVEDFEVVRETLRELLEPTYDCLAVRTAEEGLELLAAGPVDVVITDLKLPGMSGIEFLKELRSSRPGLPVIVVTGGITGVFERDLMGLGAFGYILKPYLSDEIRRMVGRAVEAASGGQAPSEGA